MANNLKEGVKIGWAEVNITPAKNVLLAGQFHARVSEGVMDPVTATAMYVESADNTHEQKQVVMVSCDLASIPDEFRDAVRERVKSTVSGIKPENIFLGATHTHAAPEVRQKQYGIDAAPASTDNSSPEEDSTVWPSIGLDIMQPSDYMDFAAGLIAEAIKRSWENRQPAGIAYGMGHAVVGRNRRLTYRDGTSKMYGKAATPEFRHVEGYEDHSVYAMMTYSPDRKLTGMVVNVACPSQVSEQIYEISADYWHETRQALRSRFGKNIHVLAQCAPAGDQSPHVLVGKRAEERMWRLKGLEPGQNAPRSEIAKKISNEMEEILPCAEKEINWAPAFDHKQEVIDLPRRIISEKDVAEALEESRPYREKYMLLMAELKKNPGIRKEHRWYKEITRTYRFMHRGERVRKRFELQQKKPDMPVETHVVRIGDIAFATNPFELYLDYGIRIRELSNATQTFLVQKAACHGTYLPSARSISCKGYGSVPASTDIGPEGGEKLVDWTVKTINSMW